MLWGRFDNERSTLNMYDNPHFEPGSGLADTDAVVAEAKKLYESLKGQHHATIKAHEVAFLLDHANSPSKYLKITVYKLFYSFNDFNKSPSLILR